MVGNKFIRFWSYGRNRGLHSFPTRRSSDLAMIVEDGLLSVAESALHIAAIDMRTRGAILEASATPPDRKSTRLNSSHMSISYAVFCLKKKRGTISAVTFTIQSKTVNTKSRL